jgi:predicted nucleic acid-binding Zn ribbon protein
MHCNSDIPIRAEHCPVCGKRLEIDFDVLAQSVQEDAAARRSEQIAMYLRWAVLALLAIAAIIYGVNDLFDRPLVYDGAGLPALPSPGASAVTTPSYAVPYADPQPKPDVPAPRVTTFGWRLNPTRDALRAASKGDTPGEKQTKRPEQIVTEGLRFLINTQKDDGSWPIPPDMKWGTLGVTSLALLCFFGEGETWIKDDKGPKAVAYADRIRKGLRYVIQQQDALTGRFGSMDGEGNHFMYNHGMATLAMCEAAGLSGDEQLRGMAQKGIDFIVNCQTPAGGWNYYGKKDGDTDTSLSSWQVQALLAGREAFLKVPDSCLKKALEMYQAATTADNRVKYSLGNDDKVDRPSLCAIALMLRQLLGEDPRSPSLRKLAERIHGTIPPTTPIWGGAWAPNRLKDDDQRALYDPYKMYYSTYAMFFLGGKEWEEWVPQMKKAIGDMQSTDGSWKTNDTWSTSGGTTYSTALTILTLQVYYRIQ